MTLLLCVASGAWAADYTITATRTISPDKKTSEWAAIKANNGTAFKNQTALGEGIYIVAGNNNVTLSGTQINVKANAVMYLEVPSSSAAGSVSIVSGNATDRYFETPSGGKLYMKGDNSTLAFTSSDIVTEDGVTYLKLSSMSDNKFNGVKIVLTSGEYIVLTKLSNPTIGDLTDGKVNISVPENASSVVYTLDGTDPSATNGTAITTATDVEITTDNTTVKAIALGDGTNYSNSSIVSKVIYLPNVTCATPEIVSINGTVQITTATSGATIKYSTDGTTYSDYTKPVTYFEATTVYAKAVRDGATDSEVATLAVEAAPAAASGSVTKILGFVTPNDNNNWEYMTANSKNYGIKGKTGTDEEGWSLWISPNGSDEYDKAISGDGSANSTYTIGGTAYQYIKNSNARQFNIGVPSGYTVNRLTIYGFNNGTTTSTSLWSLVGGTTYTAETEIPLVATAGNEPYIRVFQLDDVTDNITLNNNGAIQQCFIVAVDYTTSKCATPTIEVGDFTFADKGYPVTITSSNTLYVSTDGENYNEVTSPYTVTATATTTYYAKATDADNILEDSEVAEQEVAVTFDSSKKYVAWVYESTYENAPKNYALANDQLYTSLSTLYNVVAVDIKNYKSAITDEQKTALTSNLKSADLVVISEAVTGSGKGTIALADIVGNVPVLSMKLFAYTYNSDASKNRWGWGTPKNANKDVVSITPESKVYKVFNGVTFNNDAIDLFDYPNEQNHIQYIESWTSEPTGDVILATTGDKPAIHASTTLEYFGLGLSCDDFTKYNANAITIVKNAAAMLIAGEPLDAYKESSITKTITAAGYATLYSEYPLDFSGSGLTAYIATMDGTTVKFSEVESVPANTGVLLKGEKGEKTITVAASTTDVTSNVFEGVLEETEVDGGIYVLMGATKSNAGTGFYKTNVEKKFTVGAHTAYLPALPTPETGGARTFIGFNFDDNTTTGITSMHNAQCIMHNEVYNLNGQRVMRSAEGRLQGKNAKKGLYIVNGKKVIK